ncbi:MAG TPA: hypothetical protein VKA68_08980 [bacterium]|nr:hypothetical protein [bacterium]
MLENVSRSLDPPDNALMLSVDEKPHIQALNRTQPECQLRVGTPPRLPTTNHRHDIKIRFSILTRNVLKHGVWNSRKQLVDQ